MVDVKDNGVIRVFTTGATRDTNQDKLNFEGFLSPLVLERYAQYMHKHRKQSDGSLRAADNWQKGIDKTTYMESAWRHFFDWWRLHRGIRRDYTDDTELEEAICALLFNAQGYLFELLKNKTKSVPDKE